jgi:hypothetical protein
MDCDPPVKQAMRDQPRYIFRLWCQNDQYLSISLFPLFNLKMHLRTILLSLSFNALLSFARPNRVHGSHELIKRQSSGGAIEVNSITTVSGSAASPPAASSGAIVVNGITTVSDSAASTPAASGGVIDNGVTTVSRSDITAPTSEVNASKVSFLNSH